MQASDRILVIDDEPTIAALLVAILYDAGYCAATVSNDVGALAVLGCQPPTLVLLGAGKPGLGGTTLIDWAHASVRAATTLVVMHTAPRTDAPPHMPGARECLYKPFDVDELLACVARYVRPAQARERSVGDA